MAGNEIAIKVSVVDQTAGGADAATKRIAGVAKAAAGGPGSAAEAFTEAGKSASGFGGTLRRVGEVAAGVLAAEALQAGARKAVALIRSTVEAASDLGESLNAVQRIFGSASDKVLQWGKDNANSVGLSQRAFNQLATPLGAMLKNQGLSLDEVSDHTVKLTQRAADMASVFNTDVSDALTAIQAGLRGEQDPLERYGVSISAVAVEARAMADSHKTSAAQLTAQEKAVARLNIIYDQTASTAGDFAATSTGLANAQRIATATIEDAKAKVGTAFIPVMAKAAEITGRFAEAFTSLPQPVLLAVAAVVGLGAALLVLAPRIVATREALERMAASDSLLERSMGRSAAVIGKATLALAALTAASQIVGSFMRTSLNPQVEAASVSLQKWTKNQNMAGEAARLFGADAVTLDRSLQMASSSSLGFGKFIESWITPLQAADLSATKVSERIGALDDALAQMVKSGNGDDAAAIFQKLADRGVVSIDQLRALLPNYAAAMETASTSTTKVGQAAAGAARDIDALDKEFDSIIDKQFSLEEAQDKAADAIQRLREQIQKQKEDHEKGAGSLDRNTQAGRDNAAAVRDLVRDYEQLIVMYDDAGLSTDTLKKKLEDQLVSLGISRKEAEKYTSQLGSVKDALDAIPKETTITVKTATEKALEQLHETEREARRMYAQPVYIKVATNFVGPPGPGFGRASGGITGAESGGARGGWTMVGERGRELVRLPYGSTVIPNGTTETMLAGGHGGGGGRLEVSMMASGDRLTDAILESLRLRISANGGLAGTFA